MVGSRVRFLFTRCGESQTNERIIVNHTLKLKVRENLIKIRTLKYSSRHFETFY